VTYYNIIVKGIINYPPLYNKKQKTENRKQESEVRETNKKKQTNKNRKHESGNKKNILIGE